MLRHAQHEEFYILTLSPSKGEDYAKAASSTIARPTIDATQIAVRRPTMPAA